MKIGQRLARECLEGVLGRELPENETCSDCGRKCPTEWTDLAGGARRRVVMGHARCKCGSVHYRACGDEELGRALLETLVRAMETGHLDREDQGRILELVAEI